MAVISQIKATSDNVNYNIRDDYSIWGGRNLIAIKDSVPGYIQGGATLNLANQNSTDKETTSAYISVKAGTYFTYQCWLETLTSSQQSWIAYRFFSDTSTALTNRVAKYGTAEELYISYNNILIPEGANFMRVSWRAFTGCKVKLEIGNKPTDWSPAFEDIAKFIGDETIELYSE